MEMCVLNNSESDLEKKFEGNLPTFKNNIDIPLDSPLPAYGEHWQDANWADRYLIVMHLGRKDGSIELLFMSGPQGPLEMDGGSHIFRLVLP